MFGLDWSRLVETPLGINVNVQHNPSASMYLCCVAFRGLDQMKSAIVGLASLSTSDDPGNV